MKKFILGTLLTTASFFSLANYAEGMVESVTVNESGEVLIQVSGTPANTCTHWGRDFRFDADTENKRAMLSTLFIAYSTGAKAGIWYSSSSQNGVCDSNKDPMAVISQVAAL